MFSGQGSMAHYSRVIYRGIWINRSPWCVTWLCSWPHRVLPGVTSGSGHVLSWLTGQLHGRMDPGAGMKRDLQSPFEKFMLCSGLLGSRQHRGPGLWSHMVLRAGLPVTGVCQSWTLPASGLWLLPWPPTWSPSCPYPVLSAHCM